MEHFETSKLTRARFEELRASDKLPSPSNVALQVMEQLQQDNTCIADIAGVLQGDPALAGRLLELANSALFYPSTPVVTIKDAVTTVGLRTIQQLLLGVSIVSQHRQGVCEGFDYKLFWSQSLAMAVAAQVCCEKRFQLAPAEAFTIGLLARIGQLAAVSVYPEKYAEILRHSDPRDVSALQPLERELLDLDHLEVSCAMMEHWGLPVSVVRSVRGIYNLRTAGLERTSREHGLAQLFNYAHKLSNYCVNSPARRPQIEVALQAVGEEFGFSSDKIQEQLSAVQDKWREISAVLNMPLAEISAQDEERNSNWSSVEKLHAQRCAGPRGDGLRILIAGAQQQEQDFLENTLVKAGHYVIAACDGRDALRKILESAPEVVLADINMTEICGLQLARMLRENRYGREIYLMLFDETHSGSSAIRAWNAGADSYLSWPIGREYLMAQMLLAGRVIGRNRELTEEINTLNALSAELAHSNRKMEQQSLSDALTGLPNRRYANNRLKQCVMEASRTRLPLSVMMLDLDNFKDVNDLYGHSVGDTVLKAVADVFQRVCRGSDEVCRQGGEEFLVISRNTAVNDAAVAAERIRAAVSELVFSESRTFQITVSVGVCQLQEGETDTESMLNMADLALYDAKRAGRNCVRLAAEFDPGDNCVEIKGSAA